ncbi:OmpA family protein [Vreelandella stevensii]|uniref:OmpA family protein n=1 Tax=Vreelandella stevensii TaxID=502821 RepID=UPI0037495429
MNPIKSLILIFSIVLALPALGHEDIEGSGDHPLIERIAGSYIAWQSVNEYAEYRFPAGIHIRHQGYEESITVEGEHLRILYRFTEPTSTLRIYRSYQQSLERAGFEILFQGRGQNDELDNNKGINFVGRYDILPSGPHLRLPNRRSESDASYLLARSQDGSILASVAIMLPNLTDLPVIVLDVVTTTTMNDAMEHHPLKANELSHSLTTQGHVALQQLYFAFDSADILPESAETLNEIAELLQQQSDLRLLIVGHTDSQGSFDYNLRLSSSRAEAVKAHLETQHGVQATRLQAAGAGMMAPVASNRDESGQRLNRRVELVDLP